ncbi:MAG: PhoH family protein [Pseudomonadales bacterium]|nr:PhoH family protein [Pseudomonadales bacterium]
MLEPDSAKRLACLCGQLNGNISLIEQRLGVEIRHRSQNFTLTAPDNNQNNLELACRLLEQLYKETADFKPVTPDSIHLYLQTCHENPLMETSQQDQDTLPIISARHRSIKARGKNQAIYVESIRKHDLNFGIGPAGTGKTYLAVACAVEALLKESVERVLLVRPAVEAGEKLGFLPGDLSQKIDPYLRPLYDALYEMLGFDTVSKLLEKNIIEVAPLAYMRGRTLNKAFIILDESQNTTRAQMKMFLTRIGFGSTAVITGDTSQIDLPRRSDSGLLHAADVLKKVDGIGFTHFTSADVVRHPLVQLIVDAYEKHESQTNTAGDNGNS